MRKLISVILAVASIVCTTSSLAAPSVGNLTIGARNNIESLQSNADSTNAMPAFRGGDKIQFNVDGLTNDNILTIISYKLKDTVEFNNATIQYVNQYPIDATTKTVEYIVRNDTEEGIYKLCLNGNDESEVLNFYYKVGNPNVTMVLPEDVKYWNVKSYQSGGKTVYAVGFVAKAVIGSSDVTFEELGVENFGIELTAKGKSLTEYLSKDQFDKISAGYHEVEGGYAFMYGITVYGIDSEAAAKEIAATAVKQDKE